MKLRLPEGERGAVYPYLIFWIGVVFLAFVWIIFNEVILRVGDWVSTTGTDTGSTWGILMGLYRLTPAVLLFGLFIWAVVQGHKEGWY